MIAERRNITPDVAFTYLRSHARTNNLRLADVAQRTVDGSLDPTAIATPPGS